MSEKNANKLLIFTGGHHSGSLEVAKKLQEQGWRVVWFGHKHAAWGDKSESGEYVDVKNAGIDFFELKAGKFYRTFHPLKLLRIPFGFIQAYYYLSQFKPVGIVSSGGYLAVPTVIVGRLLGIPSITHEQTVEAGWANRLIAKFAQKVAVSWPSSSTHYPASKVVLTGLPLRGELLTNDKNKSHSKNSRPVTYITGGKQGSHVINQAVFASIEELTTKYEVIHQTGTSSIHRDPEKAEKITSPHYHHFGYDSRQAVEALRSADVVVSRSGAHISYELGVLGVPCVLIPIPWASHQEQLKNAQVLADAQQAIILPQAKLSGESLLEAIESAASLSPKKLALATDGVDRMVSLVNTVFNS